MGEETIAYKRCLQKKKKRCLQNSERWNNNAVLGTDLAKPNSWGVGEEVTRKIIELKENVYS